ncbi:MAG: DUF2231 domain-containing protein [Bacteroidales bacterium]
MIPTSHLHPMLVHFPIALIAIGFVAEVASLFIKKEICLSKISFYLLIVGTLCAILTWLSGDLFTAEMTGAAGEIRETHEIFAGISLLLLILTSILRTLLLRKTSSSWLKSVSFITYTLATIAVTITGYFGGTLVYNYMMPL